MKGKTYSVEKLNVLELSVLLAHSLELLPGVVLVLGGKVEGTCLLGLSIPPHAEARVRDKGSKADVVIGGVRETRHILGAAPVQSPSVPCL
jgi:hypothetical protein